MGIKGYLISKFETGSFHIWKYRSNVIKDIIKVNLSSMDYIVCSMGLIINVLDES